MKTLAEVAQNPSGWDSEANYVGKPLSSFSDVYIVLTRSRDSSTLEESNWRSALKRLGGESETVQIYRFGYWACGGYPSIAVCEAVMQREVEAALTLIHPYRLRGLMTGPCTPSKPIAG